MQNSNYTAATHNLSLENILLGTMYSVIVPFGSVGNVLLIIVVLRTASMHTTTNYLLSSLAWADLLTLIWCPGLYDYSLSNVHPEGIVGDYLCRFFTGNVVQAITINVSAITLTVIAVERYNALVRPMDTRARITKKNVRYVIILTWLTGIVSCVPDFRFTFYSESMGKCSRPWTLDQAQQQKIHIILTNLFLILIPLLIISYCYLQIMKGLYLTKTVISQTARSQKQRQEKKNLAKLLLSVTVVFYICFLPFGIFMIYVACKKSFPHGQSYSELYQTAHGIVRFLLFANSSVNPFLYAWQSSNYRTGFRRLVKCNCKIERKQNSKCEAPNENRISG